MRAKSGLDRTRRASHARISLVMAALIALFLLPGPAVGASSTAHQLNAAKGKLKRILQAIQVDRGTVDSLQAQLDHLNSQVALGQANLAQLTQKLTQTRDALAVAQATYSGIKGQLDTVVANAYMQGPNMELQVMLSSTSLGDLSDRMEYLNSVSLQNENLAAQVAHEADVLRTAGAQIAHLSQQQKAALTRLHGQQQQVTQKTTEVKAALAHEMNLRDQAIALVARLKKKLRAEELAAIGYGFQGGNSIPYGQWAQAFTVQIGAPTCRNNLVVLVAWQLNEFTTAAWNPLATTYPMAGATDFNSFGVKNYLNLQQGLQATQATLVQGASAYGYQAILDTLRKCADPMATAQAINASYWCHGCTLGHYVTGLVPKVEANYKLYASL